MNRTKIEYLSGNNGRTWNPLAMLCEPVSKGCANCWSRKIALNRLSNNPILSQSKRLAYKGIDEPYMDFNQLHSPTEVKRPLVIGVQFMGDLLYSKVSLWQIEDVYKVIRDCPQHQFLILTKRPDRQVRLEYEVPAFFKLPDNAWFGISAEDQDTFDDRVKSLREVSCKNKWISFEPLLGDIDIAQDLHLSNCHDETGAIRWVAVGGETGSNARTVETSWFSSISAACKEEGVHYYFKQFGTFAKGQDMGIWDTEGLTRRELPEELESILEY